MYNDEMISLKINVRTLVKKLGARLSRLQKQQLPFATALALTRTAQILQKAEKANLKAVFPTETPFTEKGISMKAARKDDLDAVVFIKDIQAVYLAPYELNGMSVPAKPSMKAMLTPKGIGVNQYGNIPYKKIKTLLGSELAQHSDNPLARLLLGKKKLPGAKIKRLQKNQARYFIGVVKTSSGNVSGLWERLPKGRVIGKSVSFRKGAFKPGKNIRSGPGLRLMVRFSDPRAVKQHLNYYNLANKVVPKNFSLELKKALRVALASAR